MLELEVAGGHRGDRRRMLAGVRGARGSDGSTVPADRLSYAPGQFLTVRVPSERTGSVARCYSLYSSPHTDEAALAVTVKRTAGGYARRTGCATTPIRE